MKCRWRVLVEITDGCGGKATWPLRFQLLIDLILPMACVVLFFLGDAVAGVIVVCVILINSAIVWPIIRYRHARQRFGSSGDR